MNLATLFGRRAVPMYLIVMVVHLLITQATFAQFDTVIDVPPDEPPAEIGSNTQLNIFQFGVVPDLVAVSYTHLTLPTKA